MRLIIRLRPLLFVFLLLLTQPLLAARAPLPKDGGFMVSTAHELATEAGRDILARGGSAVDAAITVQLVLALVEPQSSGLGGGAFMLHWSAEDKALEAYDGRETAPAYVGPDHFLRPDGQPLKHREAVLGGKSVGVPGTIAMLELAHRDHGHLPWAELFKPAIKLAKEGFPISPRLHKLMEYLVLVPAGFDARSYLYGKDGKPLPVGHILKNPAFADTLQRIADQGSKAFYEGPVARAIVERVRTAPNHPSPMTLEDLRTYRAKKREPLCRPYRVWKVCGVPPPTSGTIAVLQILGLLERFDFASLEPGTIDPVHLIAEASRLAYADRNLYVADTDYVDVPMRGMLNGAYLKKRSELIDPVKSMGKAEPGAPWKAPARAPDASPEYPGTSHATIVDSDGNVVSMTMTIEFPFGSQLMAAGFLLNNELTDFSFMPSQNGRLIANAPQPGKRPRSSMSPMIVFDGDNRPVLAIGSAGGSRIPLDVVNTIIAVLDWGRPLHTAVAMPHFANRNGPTLLEEGTPIVKLRSALEERGHDVKIGSASNSSLNGILFTEGGLVGAADPRRGGTALGGPSQAE